MAKIYVFHKDNGRLQKFHNIVFKQKKTAVNQKTKQNLVAKILMTKQLAGRPCPTPNEKCLQTKNIDNRINILHGITDAQLRAQNCQLKM